MAGERRRCGAEFEAEVALEALRRDSTIARVAWRSTGVHCTLIDRWKRQAAEGMSVVFSNTTETAATDREAELDRLQARIGAACRGAGFFAQG